MDTNVDWLDRLTDQQAFATMEKCCGADNWCQSMLRQRPFRTADRLHDCVDHAFDSLGDADWKAAFDCHPKIGDVESLKMKFAGNQQWSAGEQSGMSQADEQTIVELAAGNQAYLDRFGYIFIVCASGKSATEMLQRLTERLSNDPETERTIAAAEQRKITHLRVDKLLESNR